jgi:diguanylate cyclase (GGDEF)-like protein
MKSTQNSNQPSRPLHSLKFIIDKDHRYSDVEILDPSLLLLDESLILGHHYTHHIPQKYKRILELHYSQLQTSGQIQVYQYEIIDTLGKIRQLIGVMESQINQSFLLRVFDITAIPDYRIVEDLENYHRSIQQIKSLVESADHIHKAVTEILEVIARFCKGDRVFFTLLSEDGSRIASIEEYDPSITDSDKEIYIGIATKSIPWLMAQLQEGQAVKIPDVRALPPEAKGSQELLLSGGTIADLVVPIFIGNNLIGMIGCDSTSQVVQWTDTHVRFLQEVGQYLLGRSHLRQIKNELFSKKIEFSTLMENLPNPVFQVDQNGKLLYANESFHHLFQEIFHESNIQIKSGMNFESVTEILDLSNIYQQQVVKKQPLTAPLSLNREYRAESKSIHFQIQIVPIKSKFDISSCLVIFTDLTELLASKEELGIMHERLQSAIHANHSFIYEWNVTKDLVISIGRLDAPNTNKVSNFNEVLSRIHPDDQVLVKEKIELFIDGKQNTLQLDFRTLDPSEKYKWVSNNSRAITRSEQGKVLSFIGTITDISERKKYEESIRFLATHDSLTSLKNRNSFDSYTSTHDLANHLLLVSDMDGLKPINDTHGHQFGDRALKRIALILTNEFPDADFIGRIGGDEFAIILPPLRRSEVTNRIHSIKSAIQNQSDLPMETNLSIGYSFSRQGESFEALFQRAEDRMYKDKLTNRTSSKASVVLSLMKSLQEKNLETEEHCHRVETYGVAIAERMRLDYHIINEIKLLAKLHDIGKIAIPIQILNKPGPLSAEEWLMMKQHSEIGARIVSASPNMDTIAEGILYHHERWDGNGYPEGRSGTKIPLTSRILNVVDSYDAMISNRCYNKSKNRMEALEELALCSGSQFDPFITKLFISILQSE